MRTGSNHSEKAKKRMREARLKNNPGAFKAGEKNSNWNGGITIHSDGYVCILKPEHPYSNSYGYVRRSRLVMEKHLGRYLDPKEIPHHKNEIRDDDRIENLRLFASNGKHISFHRLLERVGG